MPLSIVSDRDPIFTSLFWRELFKLQCTQLKHSSGYHPQTDGQSKVVKRCLKTYLRCFVGTRPRDWAKWLSLAEWWYTTNSHSSIEISPFEEVYGRPPPRLLSYVKRTTQVQAVNEQLRSRDQIAKLLKENLVAAQQRMKKQKDLHRTERSFQESDWVYLCLQPYRWTSVAMRGVLILSPWFYGPYQVVQKIGQVAYKLDLPPSAKIHPIFHVSQLKKKLGQNISPQMHLPHITDNGILLLRFYFSFLHLLQRWPRS